MIVIKKWYGRLGNNITQLENVIHMAIYYKTKIDLPRHKFFNVEIIKKYFDNNNHNQNIPTPPRNFFCRSEIKDVPSEVFSKNKKKVKKILQKAFKLDISNIKKIPDNYVVIHVRSGDIFTEKKPHKGYTPPPLVYYTNLLDSNKFDKIIIVCEDRINPVVNKLLKIYDNAYHSINNLENDIKIILGAQNLIMSKGTFIPKLLLMSNNIKKLYTTNMLSNQLENYYIHNRPWRNTKTQRKLIKNYKIN